MMIGFCGGNSVDFKNTQTNASNNLSNNSLFKKGKESHMVQRGTDILITVDVENAANTTANEIVTKATSDNSAFPAYKPDGCGAILLFHTPNHEIYGLGGLRDNPALKEHLSIDGTPFQSRVNTTIGGRLFDSEIPLRESIMKAIKYKMFFNADIAENSPIYEAQQVIKSLIVAIEASEGWNTDVCVHTDRWENNDKSIGTMCFLTGIKHINCTDDELKKIEEALKVIMDYKQSQGEQSRNLSNFKFYPFINTMKNATAEYLIKRTELEKAEKADQNKAFVTFNDLCLETFRANGTYTKMGNRISELSLTVTTSAVNIK